MRPAKCYVQYPHEVIPYRFTWGVIPDGEAITDPHVAVTGTETEILGAGSHAPSASGSAMTLWIERVPPGSRAIVSVWATLMPSGAVHEGRFEVRGA
jgi:hypothetical protein